MKDRFVLVGALALLVAALSSMWLLGSRSPAPAIQLSSTAVAEISPTAEPANAPSAANTAVALVVALDGLGGAGAFAQSGDHVALLGFIPAEINEGNAMTRVLLSDVTVLQGSADSALTLAVSPEQALFVRSAQGLGVKMFVALRPADGSIAPQTPEGVSERDLRALLRGQP